MVGCVEKLQINYVTLSQCVWLATKPYWFLHNLLLAVDHIWTTVKQFIMSWSLEKQSKVSRHKKIDWLLGVLQLQILKQYIKPFGINKLLIKTVGITCWNKTPLTLWYENANYCQQKRYCRCLFRKSFRINPSIWTRVGKNRDLKSNKKAFFRYYGYCYVN